MVLPRSPERKIVSDVKRTAEKPKHLDVRTPLIEAVPFEVSRHLAEEAQKDLTGYCNSGQSNCQVFHILLPTHE